METENATQCERLERVAVTAEELNKVIDEQNCSVGVRTALHNIAARFESPRLFLAASDAELKRQGRCGATMLALIGEVKRRCFFLQEHLETRFRYNALFEKYLKRRDEEQARQIAELNPVFTVNDLQAAALYMSEEKVEYIDLRSLNGFRRAMTQAQRDVMKRKYEEEQARLAEREKTLADDGERRREAERKEREKAEREAAEKGEKPMAVRKPRKGKGRRNVGK